MLFQQNKVYLFEKSSEIGRTKSALAAKVANFAEIDFCFDSSKYKLLHEK
jgi:hypothetical protein